MWDPSWHLGFILAPSWLHLGSILGSLGSILANLNFVKAHLASILAPSWLCLGPGWARLNASEPHLRFTRIHFGEMAHLGPIFEFCRIYSGVFLKTIFANLFWYKKKFNDLFAFHNTHPWQPLFRAPKSPRSAFTLPHTFRLPRPILLAVVAAGFLMRKPAFGGQYWENRCSKPPG